MAHVQIEAVYAERNQLVAALCKLFPAVRYCDGVWTAVYVDLPTGQVSWHYGARDAWLFAHCRSREPTHGTAMTQARNMRG